MVAVPSLHGDVAGAMRHLCRGPDAAQIAALKPDTVVLATGGVLLERNVVTPREEVEMTLDEIARLVESNQLSAAIEYIHSSQEDVKAKAEGELEHYEFSRVDIKSNLKSFRERALDLPTVTVTHAMASTQSVGMLATTPRVSSLGLGEVTLTCKDSATVPQ